MGDETRVQMREVKKGAEALGGIAERYMMRTLGPLGRRLQASTRAGRIMALAGVIAVVASLALIFSDALTFHTETGKSVLVATKAIVNVRDLASTKGRVVTKVERGDKLTHLGSAEGWYKVRTRGVTGWVSEDTVEGKGNRSLVIEYEMKGYGIVFLAGIALVAAGIVRKQK